MELTLKIPDEMVSRLRPHEKRLVRILELGLEALETTGRLAEDDAKESEPPPDTWRSATRDLVVSARGHQDGESPTPEELLAYAQGELDDAARKDLMDRVALDAEAVDDLLDFYQFEDLEPPSAEHALSDREVRDALGTLRGRIAEKKDRTQAEDETVPMAKIEPIASKWPRRTRPLLAMAASLVLAVGFLWIVWQDSGTTPPRHGTVMNLNNTRGGREFPLVLGTERVLLIFPKANLPAGGPGELRLSTSQGQVVYQSEILGTANEQSDGFLSLPGEDLPAGSYRIEIFDSTTGKRVNTLEFIIGIPPDF